MPRVTDADVKTIFETTLDTAPFINVANVLVDGKLSKSGLSSELLTQIELWLAAHFAAIRDPQVKTVKDGSASVTAHGKSGLGLDATLYGQQVKVLDCTGILASLGQQRAEFCVI